jgi:hypothetical protein
MQKHRAPDTYADSQDNRDSQHREAVRRLGFVSRNIPALLFGSVARLESTQLGDQIVLLNVASSGLAHWRESDPYRC